MTYNALVEAIIAGADRTELPAGYPLPVDQVTGIPWWKINMTMIFVVPGWKEHQRQRLMAELIPIMNWLLAGRVAK